MVAVDPGGDPTRVVGFYTLVPHEFRGEELPDVYRKRSRIGSLRAVPGALLAQLGVSLVYHGQGIGKTLVAHALTRCVSLAEGWGCVAVVADPLDERAARLYAGFDFASLGDGSRRMILTVGQIINAVAAAKR